MSWILIVEELRSLAHLDESSLPHGLLDDNIEDLTHSLAVLPFSVVYVSRIDHKLSLSFDDQSDFASTES